MLKREIKRAGGVCVALILATACGLGGGRPDDHGDRLDEDFLLEGFDGPLSEAAAFVRNEGNWSEPNGDDPAGDSGSGDPTGNSDEGAGAGTCDGACGGISAAGDCYCDDQCAGNGDCCSDYDRHCDPATPDGDTGQDGGGDAAGTCAGACGGASSDGSCYCDEQCSGSGDCCSDYAQHCNGSDSGGDSGQGDPGPVAGTCAGYCGGAGSDGACYCDDQCASNGDCCDDYMSQCPTGGGGSGGDPPVAGSCAGLCGGAGSDGSCYCDDQCGSNGDCCDDYDLQCGVGIAHDPSFDLTAQGRSAAGTGSACWGILTDPVDVSQVAQYAAAGGAAFGGGCVAVLVVPAGAGAVATGGLSIGAAAIACSGTAVAGSIGGALTSLASQKMGSVAECSGAVMSEITRLFPWGKGEKVVPVYGSSPAPADPGDCSPDKHRQLQDEVNTLCKNAGQRSCTATNTCETIMAKIEMAAKCIAARRSINSQCYGPGDEGHNEKIQNEQNLVQNCHNRAAALGGC